VDDPLFILQTDGCKIASAMRVVDDDDVGHSEGPTIGHRRQFGTISRTNDTHQANDFDS
jgi:hypothetical protein